MQPVIVPIIQRLLKDPRGFKPLQAVGFVTTVTPGLQQMAIELASIDMRLYMRTVRLAGEHRSEPWLHEVTIPVAITGGRAIGLLRKLKSSGHSSVCQTLRTISLRGLIFL